MTEEKPKMSEEDLDAIVEATKEYLLGKDHINAKEKEDYFLTAVHNETSGRYGGKNQKASKKNRFRNALGMLLSMLAIPNIGPYCTPTVYRLLKANESSEEKLSTLEEGFGLYGAIVGMSILFPLQATIYYAAVEDGHPEYLLIPVATNIVSGIYELFKWKENIYKKK